MAWWFWPGPTPNWNLFSSSVDVSVGVGGPTARGRTGNGRRVMANIFWMGSAARFPGSELVTKGWSKCLDEGPL